MAIQIVELDTDHNTVTTLDGRRYTVAPSDVGTLSAWKPMQQLAVSWDKLYNLELDTSVRFVMVE